MIIGNNLVITTGKVKFISVDFEMDYSIKELKIYISIEIIDLILRKLFPVKSYNLRAPPGVGLCPIEI